MSFVYFRLDITDAIKGLDSLGKKAPQAIVRAINRSAESGRSLMTREVAKDTGLRAKDVRPEIQIIKATTTRYKAMIFASGRRIALIKFGARGPEPSRGRGRGVTYRLPGGAGKNQNAFIATMKSGHRGVFKRVSKARLGLTELHGPSLPHVFSKFMVVGQQRAQEQLVKNLQSEIRFAQMR